jgi:HSP20 family protein
MRRPLVKFENTLRSPFRFFDDFDKEFGRLVEGFPNRVYETKSGFGACDIEDKESHYLITLDLPGVPKNEINVEAADGSVKIWGERKSEKKEGDYTERHWGRFERTIPLPLGVDEKHIEAHFDNGVLSLAIPKSGEPKSKMIEIKEKKEGVFSKLI